APLAGRQRRAAVEAVPASGRRERADGVVCGRCPARTAPMTMDSPTEARSATAFSITNSPPSERRLTGEILFLLAGLAALGALATNIILPAFPRIGAGLGVSSQELGLTLSGFFVAFAFGQLLV